MAATRIEEQVSGSRLRLRTCAQRLERHRADASAEVEIRDQVIVELYEAHVRVDQIALDAGLSRARILAIVGES